MQEDHEGKASLGYIPSQKEQMLRKETLQVDRRSLSLVDCSALQSTVDFGGQAVRSFCSVPVLTCSQPTSWHPGGRWWLL